MTGSELTLQEFQEKLLAKYCNTGTGITLRGLKDYLRDVIKEEGEDSVRAWLSTLGYDEHLFNKESRGFIVTFHSLSPF